MKKYFSFYKDYNWINIIGLSIGITSVLAIMLWVEDELKYDSFNINADLIYRILVEENGMEGYSNSAMTMLPLADVLKEKIPDIEKAANFEMNWHVVVKTGTNFIKEDGMAIVGTDFFDIFSFPFIKGDPQLIKTEKYSVILSESTAEKYFGKEDAIGKQIEINKIPVNVIAILRDIDYNSHIRYDLAIPEELGNKMFGRIKEKSWGNRNLYTYIKVADGVALKFLDAKLYNFIPDNINPDSDYKLLIQPLKDIHFQKNLSDEDYTYLGDKRYVYIFSFVGLLILILACVNFINLSTAVSEKTISNNRIRRIFGASKAVLIKTSVLKSVMISVMASIIALYILYLIFPFINLFVHKNLGFSFVNPFHIVSLIAVALFSGILSGFYPSFYLASFLPTGIIKIPDKVTAQWQRKGLVVFQFSLSIFLIIATLVSLKQFNHIRKMNLGFDKENTIYFNLKTEESNYQTLKERLLKIPGIEMVAGKNYYSPMILNTTQVRWQGNEISHIFSDNIVDEDFFSLLKVKFIEGRNFSREFKNDNSIIINRKAKELMGIDNTVGMNLILGDSQFEIIGVIDEVHFRSVNEKIQPEFYTCTDSPDNIFVRYEPNNTGTISHLTDQIRTTVRELYPEAPFNFQFLDETYAKLYETDKRNSIIFCIMAVIAILISCLGLFGLSSYGTKKRTKEIGIRKVNGARIIEIIAMLNKEFVKWVIIAFIIATPIAYYIMRKWLQHFDYKTDLSWWIFALAGISSISIALITVSWQSYKAATRNPVEALRYE